MRRRESSDLISESFIWPGGVSPSSSSTSCWSGGPTSMTIRSSEGEEEDENVFVVATALLVGLDGE